MSNAAIFENTALPVQPLTAADGLPPNPAQRSAASSLMLPRIELVRSCYGGTETMRQMGEIFLPMHGRETPERWERRLNATFVMNKMRQAVDSASAKPFRNILTLAEADPQLTEWCWDADLRGHHLHLVAHNFFNEAVLAGMAHILVDHPTTTGVANLAEQRALNPRPFMRIVRAEDLLACYVERIDGENRIVHARISSSRVAFNRANFSEQIIDQVYVLEQDVVQLWERPRIIVPMNLNYLGQGANIYVPRPLPVRYAAMPITGAGAIPWELKGEKRISVKGVPLVTMTAGNEEADMVVKPMFEDLAYKQVHYWQSSSDQTSILSVARFPMLAVSGVQLEETIADPNTPAGQAAAANGTTPASGFEIGPHKILVAPDAQGRWYYVEPQGHAIAAGEKDLENIERHMDLLALNPVISANRQYVSQDELAISENRINSVIHDLAIDCKDALEQAICYMGQWVGKDYSKVRAQLNLDFSGTDEKSKDVTQILNAVQKGVLSREGALTELVRLNLLNEDFDMTSELARDPATAELTRALTITQMMQDQGDPEAAAPKPSKQERDFNQGKTRPK